METIIEQIFTTYGPAAIPWVLAALAWYFLWKDRHPAADMISQAKVNTKDMLDQAQHHVQDYKELAEAYRAAVVENTKITERLAILIEERTRKLNNARD